MATKLEAYVSAFNQNDEELFRQEIPNSNALEWMKQEIPLFECPDKTIEETYYFRWWVFRKHIKRTPEGRIITEFLPHVPWSGPYNSINCAAGHHLAEARWLRKDRSLATEYIRFWFRGSGDVYSYSSWIVDAVYQFALATGDKQLAIELLDDFIRYYETIEQSHFTRYGLFWSHDDRDAMEMSISGDGLRPTLNSYMAANASAIAKIAEWAGRKQESQRYKEKAAQLQENIRRLLWDPDAEFFKVIPMDNRDTVLESLSFHKAPKNRNVREAIGYIPWGFGIPAPEHEKAWKFLQAPEHFAALYGPTTAERCHPDFMRPCPTHECLWNGPSWPFSTTQILNSMIAALHRGDGEPGSDAFLSVLKGYAKSHYRLREDGRHVNWLDENLDPDTGEWLSRRILRDWGWPESKAGYERGKDYNHSAFCDLVIRGICGVQLLENGLSIKPLLPPGTWPYFRLEGLPYHDRSITIGYDADGSRYQQGAGLWVEVDGQKVAQTSLGHLVIDL